jgi:uncharacterized protein
MPVELRPLGVGCNIRCHYCYQNPERDAGGYVRKYQLTAMKAAIEKEKTSFTLFGGEALLVPEADLEHLWSWGWEKFRRNGIQTNGVLINENHIRMFKQYHVSVGISIDGPDELNDIRWAGSLEATRKATAKTESAIRRLCEEKIHPSLIITLHRANATTEKISQLTKWLQEMDQLGIRSVRLHILEVDNPLVREKYVLSTEENVQAFLHFAELEKQLKKMRFDVFRDIRRLLVGRDNDATCVWTGCDPYTTAAVRGVEGNGQRSNCGRTNKEGVDFVKSDTLGYERYLALYHTPQEHGGCSGCRYFLMCKGQCPGTAINGDWRNRTEHCLVWKALFAHFEKEIQTEGKEEILSDELRDVLEGEFIKAWSMGRNTTMERLLPAFQKPSQANRALTLTC